MLRRALLFIALTGLVYAQGKKLAPSRFNLFSPQQDIELGKEAAAEIEKQVAVIDNRQLNDYVNRIGKKLASQPDAGDYPYTFKVVYDNSINAFALPGGPTYTHTGLILQAENEAQIAGVLAHEISHVALRHGTSQVTKAQATNIFLGLGASLIGNGSMLGQLAQLGVGLGANSLLLKFSRSAESDADLNGARIMAQAGYDPVEMARFFEKLEAAEKESGRSIPQFLSDHPSPGNRVRAVSDEVKRLPRAQYTKGNAAELQRIQKLIQGLPAPPKANTDFRASDPSAARPSSRLKQFTGRAVTLSYPENWQASQNSQSGEITIAAPAGVAKAASGANEIAYGVLSGIQPVNGPVDIDRDTQAFLKSILQRNPNMKPSGRNQSSLQVSGAPARLNLMYNASAYTGQREVDAVITAAHPDGLFYLVLIAPEAEYTHAQPIFDNVIRSIQFHK